MEETHARLAAVALVATALAASAPDFAATDTAASRPDEATADPCSSVSTRMRDTASARHAIKPMAERADVWSFLLAALGDPAFQPVAQ